jgi:hypothetical protein
MFIRGFICILLLAGCTFAQAISKDVKSALPATAVSNDRTGGDATTAAALPQGRVEYRLLATNRTSTMQKEMNQAAEAGYRFGGVMGGETSFGGSEVVVIMVKDALRTGKPKFEYQLLATSKTSTMQKELQQAGDGGFEYQGQTVFSSTFGGKEVVVILERDPDVKVALWEYKLLATKKTSTMEKELNEAGAAGYQFVGVTVGDTALGGKEVVSILRRPRAR